MKKLWLISLIFILLAGCNPAKNSVKQDNNTLYDEGFEFSNEVIGSKQIHNDLFVLGKIWGFLKYYHPNVAAGEFDWDVELFKILPEILEAKSLQERDSAISEWITDLGTFEEEKKQVADKNIIIEPDLDWISELNFEESLESVLIQVKNAKKSSENHYISLAENVGNPVFNEESYVSMDYENDGYRLLSLYRYWNIIEYFFPYKNLIDEDWDDVLQEFIPKYISDSTELNYKLTTLELIGRIHDTHANIWNQDEILDEFWGVNSAPFRLSFIENKPVVTGYYEQYFGKKSGLIYGDVITKINGQPVEEMIKEKLKYIPASNYPTKLRDIAPKLIQTNEKKLNIEIKREGTLNQAELEVYPLTVLGFNQSFPPKTIDKDGFLKLDSNIAYLYLGNLFNSDLPDIMKQIRGAKGLIIDLRAYPADFILYNLSEYLLPKKTTFTKITIGSIEKPGLFKTIIELENGKTNKNYFKGKVIILVNEQTQSQGEFTAMAFRQAPDALVIGSTTAGADGNVSPFQLPGGINTGISGIGIYNPDGSDTQRVGIIPDITVTPTIEGIKQNKDEVLEKAISLINDKSKE
ncbi:S41 family peptidase [Bacillus sp. CGMCC 1.16607]|uniref:S41 family peptidase n=1 Tax=Bacillus sp. CGMCC 1.16607 TaxID=3351842 RepID=UPI00362EBA29